MKSTAHYVHTLLFLILFSTTAMSQPLADGNPKFLGNIVSTTIPSNFGNYWNQVTPENAGKWGSVEPNRNSYNWGALNTAYNYAVSKNIPFKYHNFIWGQQQPSWISSLDSASIVAEIEELMSLVAQKYPDIDFIDVVNEPINAPPSYKAALGGDGKTGWDWVIWAFEKARQYFPNAKLAINEYNVLKSTTTTNKYIGIINLLKDRGLVDIIGEQGHFLETTSNSTIKSNLDKLGATGLPIHISEYDINIADDSQQLKVYQEQFPVLWEHPAVQGITLWGYRQYSIWREDAYLIRSNNVERPALEWLRDYILSTTDVEDQGSTVPSDYELYQNYPNPFNPSTKIKFGLPENGNIRIVLYDSLGNLIQELVNGNYSAGYHTAEFNASAITSGIYFYRLESSSYTATKKIILLK